MQRRGAVRFSAWNTALRALCLLLWVGCCHATDPHPATARFRRLDSGQGLSQDSVLAMVQDRHGLVWLGTQEGLNRYDGYEVRAYRADRGRAHALAASWVAALAIDREDQLWVGTNGGLHRYDPTSDGFQRFAPDPNRPNALAGEVVHVLHVDGQGRLWIGSDAGLAQWRPATADFANYRQLAGEAHGLPDDRVRAIASDRDGMLWLGTVAGLARFDPAAQHWLPLPSGSPLGAEPINALLVDRAGRLWIGSDQSGLVRFDPNTGHWQQWRRGDGESALPHDRVHALLQDRDAAIWIGTEAGALRAVETDADLRLQAYLHHRHNPHSPGRGRVTSLLQDNGGTLWLGSWEGGAARLSPFFSRFHSFDPDAPATAGMRSPAVLALTAEDDTLWLGTNDGAYTFDLASYQLQTVEQTPGLAVFALQLDEREVWLGTGTGLRVIDRASQALSRPSLPAELVNARLRRLMLDGDRVWLAAELLGVYVFERRLGVPLAVHAFKGNVYNIAVFDADTVAVSAGDGLYWYSRDGLRLLYRQPIDGRRGSGRLPAPTTGFARDGQGRVWAASYGAGVLRLQPDAPTEPASISYLEATAGHDLANRGINDILVDGRDRLWLATDRGISRFDPQALRVRNFDANDGALGRGYYFSAAATLSSGRLAFGSKDGFTVFDPHADDAAPPLPAPLLTALLRDNREVVPSGADAASPLPQPLHQVEELQLPAGWGRSLGLRFAVTDYVTASQLRYRYRLEGFDEDWVDVDASRRQASYTNLGPGAYRFRVLALNRAGELSAETRLDLHIAPWWWQTAWARGLALLLIGAVLWAAHRWRLGRLEQQRLALERVVGERTQALAEAKENAESSLVNLQATQRELVRAEKLSALGELVAGVAHEVNTPLGVALTASSYLRDAARDLARSLKDGSLRRAELESFVTRVDDSTALVERNLDRAAQLVRNFKQVSVDRSSDGRRQFDLAAFLAELLQSLELLWKRRPIKLLIDCPGGLVLDSFPGALGQIITNLAQNAVLHAFGEEQPGQMRLQVRALDEARVELRFADNGRGIPAKHLARIFEPFFTTRRQEGGTGLGLHITHNLVTQKLGGSIDVSSTPGQGSEFVLVLPRKAPGA